MSPRSAHQWEGQEAGAQGEAGAQKEGKQGPRKRAPKVNPDTKEDAEREADASLPGADEHDESDADKVFRPTVEVIEMPPTGTYTPATLKLVVEDITRSLTNTDIDNNRADGIRRMTEARFGERPATPLA